MYFKNKVVLITGGSHGIGAAIAVAFAKKGANIAIVGRNEDNLKKVAQTCGQYGQETLIIKVDITKEDDLNTVVEKTVKKFGKLDVLVNNAGMIKTGEILKGTALEAYDTVFRVNMRAVVQVTSLAVPHLIKTKGNIVNVSSVLGKSLLFKYHNLACYGMSKAALNYFTRSLASELGPHGIRANTVSPGATKTALFSSAGITDAWDVWGQSSALGKVAEAEEVADVVMYLASDKAMSITGSDFTIDNGITLQ